jgi:hypothetical protein
VTLVAESRRTGHPARYLTSSNACRARELRCGTGVTCEGPRRTRVTTHPASRHACAVGMLSSRQKGA